MGFPLDLLGSNLAQSGLTARAAEVLILCYAVITSYSIHYTKLYDYESQAFPSPNRKSLRQIKKSFVNGRYSIAKGEAVFPGVGAADQ